MGTLYCFWLYIGLYISLFCILFIDLIFWRNEDYLIWFDLIWFDLVYFWIKRNPPIHVSNSRSPSLAQSKIRNVNSALKNKYKFLIYSWRHRWPSFGQFHNWRGERKDEIWWGMCDPVAIYYDMCWIKTRREGEGGREIECLSKIVDTRGILFLFIY